MLALGRSRHFVSSQSFFTVLKFNNKIRIIHTRRMMSDLTAELTAPNGVKYTQPLGLFINNEWVKSSDGGKITTINPTYVVCMVDITAISLAH
jgi:hypothetical protein